MKITFISYIYPYPSKGYNPGIERVIGELSHSLANNGHEINVITTYRNGGILKSEKDKNVNIYRINDIRNIVGKPGSIFSLDLLSINYFIKEYRNIIENSDVIHSFTPYLLKHPGIPLVTHFHHHEFIRDFIEYLYVPTENYLWERTFENSDAILSVSHYSAQYLINSGIPESKVDILPNMVDTTKYNPHIKTNGLDDRFKGKKILLFVGLYQKRKGLEYLIKAMPKIVSNFENVLLLLVGAGHQEHLESLCNELNIRKNVIFEGFVPEEKLPMYYNICDLFVLPSLQEGFGIVLIEAMACGKTVIASDITAIPEVVGDAGILVQPMNSEELSKEIINLLNDTDKRKNLENKSLNRVKNNFTNDKVVKNLEQLYTNLKLLY